MLAGHPSLFCPPELNLLPYLTMKERDEALGPCHAFQCVDSGCDLREGLVRALMALEDTSADQASEIIGEWTRQNRTIAEVYATLQELASPRTLLDKSPMNVAAVEILRRAEQLFERPLYIHLVRHPYAVIQSLIRHHVDIANASQPEALAEKYWTIANSNIFEFLGLVDANRQHLIRYESLVGNSVEVMTELCAFLGYPFDNAVLRPYDGDRMISGVRPDSLSVGDPNLLKHRQIEPELGDVWKEIKLMNPLGAMAQHLANGLLYEIPEHLSS
jgi:hypothetical protein